MNRTIIGLLSLVACIGLSGCKSTTSSSSPAAKSDGTVFDYMQELSADLIKEGRVAAVGIGKSRQIDMAVAAAKANARKNLAQSLQVKVESLEKMFVEEVGEAENAEINRMFSSATEQITSLQLEGTVPIKQKRESGLNGVEIVYVLMVQDPQVVDIALKNSSTEHLYERFRASKAFEELDQEIKEFEAAEKEGFFNP